MIKMKWILCTFTIIFSSLCQAVQCTNTKTDNSDDFNLNMEVSGLAPNSRSLSGNPITLKASASWLFIAMKDLSSSNAKLFLDGSLIGESTAPIGNTNPSISQIFTSLTPGTHTAVARSSNDTTCSTQRTFVIQTAPVANANGNYSAVIANNNSSSIATINLQGTYQTDTVNSVNLANPELNWEINGTTYVGDAVSVDLPHGTYSAKFTVKDGTFTDSDTVTVTVIDELKIEWMYSEPVCMNNIGRVRNEWENKSGISYYEIEHKPNGGSWYSVGTTTTSHYLLTTSSETRIIESLRARACTSSRCGQWATESFFPPNCNNFVPN